MSVHFFNVLQNGTDSTRGGLGAQARRRCARSGSEYHWAFLLQK